MADAPDRLRERSRPRALLERLVFLTAAGAVFASLGAAFAENHWTLELMTHFKAQLAVGVVLVASLALYLRLYPMVAVCVLVFAFNAAHLLPYLMPQPKAAVAKVDSWRFLSANVSYRNRDFDALRRLVEELRPDVIGLVEINSSWAGQLEALYSDYPYRIVRPEEGAYGLALLSRVPLSEPAENPYRRDGINVSIMATVALGEEPVHVMLVHVRAPTSPAAAALRNAQLADLSAMIRANGDRNQVLIGDLNVTPWSPYFALVEADAGLVNAARGNGYLGTWPTSPAFLRIPIDYCLLSNDLEAAGIRTGPDIGSDHLPLIIDVFPAGVTRQSTIY